MKCISSRQMNDFVAQGCSSVGVKPTNPSAWEILRDGVSDDTAWIPGCQC